MATKSEKKSDKSIKFRIDYIRTNKFYEKHFSEYNLEYDQIKETQCKLGFGLNINSEKERLIFPLKVDFYLVGNETAELFGVETIHTFGIKNFRQMFSKDEEGKYDIPSGFIERLLGIALGGTRGILFASVTVPEYKKILLPLMNTKELTELMKKDPEYGKEEQKKE